MSATSRQIAMTIRLPNELYHEFHSITTSQGSTHVGVIRILIREWVEARKKSPRSSRRSVESA